MDIARLKIITYRAIKTTGTIIVNLAAFKLLLNKLSKELENHRRIHKQTFKEIFIS
jgi:hypothetical protein